MKLVAIQSDQFALWKHMRKQIYPIIDDEYDDQEMLEIIVREDWFCYFVLNDNQDVMGLVELSSRNIVDGCLTSPVAYLEGLYLLPEYRGRGLGKKTMQMIMQWSKDKGFAELATDAELENEAAQQFYKAIGFEEVDRVVEFRIKL